MRIEVIKKKSTNRKIKGIKKIELLKFLKN